MNKKTEQTYIEKLETLEKTLKEGDKGLITAVEETTNTKFYGVISNYGEKHGIAITIKINSPDGEEFKQFYTLTDSIRGLEKANIFLFKKKYGKYPQKGVEVELKINENGFYEIVI